MDVAVASSTGSPPTSPYWGYAADAATSDPSSVPSGNIGRSWRTAASAFFAATAIVCLVLGNVALWMRHDVYSTTTVTREAQQIGRSPNVQRAVASLLVTRVVQPAIDQTLTQSLPSWLSPLRQAAEGPALKLATQLIDRAVASQTAQDVAARLVATVTPQLEKGSGPISLSPDQLARIISPSLAANSTVAEVLNSADHSGCCNVVLAQRKDLPLAWRHVSGIRTAGLALPAAAVISAGLALGLARRRRRVAVVLAAATALAGLLTLTLLWASVDFGGNLMGHSGPATALAPGTWGPIFDRATTGLRDQSWAVAAGGTIALLALGGAGRLKSRQRVPVSVGLAGRHSHT
jgi:hypothetical protein